MSGARSQKSVLEESSIVAFEEVEEKLKIIHEQERVSPLQRLKNKLYVYAYLCT